MQIKIDVTDWQEEALREEVEGFTEDELVTLAVENGYSSAQLARIYVVQREMGLADSTLLPDNKNLLQYGGTAQVGMMFKRRVKEIEIAGKKQKVREMVASMPEEEPEDDGYFANTWYVLGTQEALDSAWRYLQRQVVGRIVGRLNVIHESGGDVLEAVEWLRGKLDEIAEDFAEPGVM